MGQLVEIPFEQIATASMQLVRTEDLNESLTGQETITEFPRAVWVLNFNVITLTKEQAGAWRGPMARLSRRSNYFEITPPEYQGTEYQGLLAVTNGGNLGTSMAVTGASDTTVLKAGDYFEVRGEVKMVVQDCVTNGSGQATLEFEPAMRQTLAANDPIEIQTPKVRFRLAEPRAGWQVAQGLFHAININAVEVFK